MNKLNRKNLMLSTTVLVALVLIISLFVIRIGVSDNGMQYKLLEKLGLYDAYQTTGTGYYSQGYGIANKAFSKTSYGLMYDLVKQLFPVDGILFTALPAILYFLIFVCAVMLIIFSLYSEKFMGMNISVCALLILMFCDSAYIAYFNTPYTNAPFFVYLFALIAMFLYSIKTKKIIPLLFYGIFVCLFANTSIVAAISAIILGVFTLRLISVKKDYVWRVISVILSIVIVIAGFLSITTADMNLYDAVFYGASLEDSAAIEKLGLDSALNEYKGVPSFDEKAQEFINSAEYKEKFTSEISVMSILGYYLKNVPQFINGIKKVGYNSTSIRTAYLSGFTSDTGKSGMNTKFFTLYSTAKSKAMPGSIIAFLIVIIALIVVSLTYRNNYAKSIYEKIICEFSVAFACCTILTYPIPYILNGMTQIGFNMFNFNAMFDICIFMLIIGTINLLMTKKNILREKYGVNQ